mgnify:CR=1 FL=1
MFLTQESYQANYINNTQTLNQDRRKVFLFLIYFIYTILVKYKDIGNVYIRLKTRLYSRVMNK